MHVKLRVGEEDYALPVGDVRSVIALEEVAPVLGAPRSVLGLCALHGQLLPVFDLAELLGVAGAVPRRIVVAARAGLEAGFAVDDVLDVAELPASEDAPDGALLSGSLLVGDGLVGVIDLAAVLAALEAELDA